MSDFEALAALTALGFVIGVLEFVVIFYFLTKLLDRWFPL